MGFGKFISVKSYWKRNAWNDPQLRHLTEELHDRELVPNDDQKLWDLGVHTIATTRDNNYCVKPNNAVSEIK